MRHRQRHSEAGQTRDERRTHDSVLQHHEEISYAKPSQPNWVPCALRRDRVLVVSLTLLFVGGFITW